MTLALTDVSYVEANCGRWVARCVRPWCTNAMAVAPGQESMTCEGIDGCGATAVLHWPPDPDAIELILLMRPVPRTRNWLPGETLEQLLRENAEHGVIPAEWELLANANGGSLELIRTEGERVVGGLLYGQLESARRRELEGA